MSRIAIDLGFIQVYWYSIMIILGLIAGTFIILWEAKRQNIDQDTMINLIFYGVIFAIIGARLYYITFNIEYYMRHFLEIFEIWNGGLAIHGAMIGGGLYTIYYSKRYNLKLLKLIDIIVVGLIIGQAIGRWGNFFNQEAYGGIVSLEYLKGLHLPQFIIDGMKIGGLYRHPTFLYESIWDVLGFIVLVLFRRYKYTKVGQTTALYMIWYGFGRFFIERLREDSLMFLGIRVAQFVSLTMIILGVAYFGIQHRRSKLEHNYNDNMNK